MTPVPPGVSLDEWAEAYCNRGQVRRDLQDRIAKAERAYRAGKPIMSDEEFDRLVDDLAELDRPV